MVQLKLPWAWEVTIDRSAKKLSQPKTQLSFSNAGIAETKPWQWDEISN